MSSIASHSTSSRGPSAYQRGWKRRLEDPTNTFYRYPLAWPIARSLVSTRITPNQVSVAQPFLAALAGYLVTFDDYRYLVLGALCFEVRSVLDCVDGTLAREKNMASAGGHAIDALCDWLGVLLLYAGIFVHFHLHPPPPDSWSHLLGVDGVLCLALFQGGMRSFTSDYYKIKYVSIFERGRDETIDGMRRKIEALGPRPSVFARVEVLMARIGHLTFEHEWFDPARDQGAHEEKMKELSRRESSPSARLLGMLWSVSNGDAFLTLVILSLLLNQLWFGQVLFATVGTMWTVLVLFLNAWFVRSAGRRAKLAMAA